MNESNVYHLNEYVIKRNGMFRRITILASFTVLSVVGYLIYSSQVYQLGFPLDDAWIHQTYARNFAENGEWAYMPGAISAGSTAPLWTFLLSIGYLLKCAPYFWTYLLGGVGLWLLAIIAEEIFRKMVPQSEESFPWIGLLITGEWHLAWAAVSGMETILYSSIIILVIFLLLKDEEPWLRIGVAIGAIVWLRPDGLTLLGPAIFVLFLNKRPDKTIRVRLLKLLLGFLVLFIPYLIFNRLMAGNWMPNTFYAKQAEYAVLLQTSVFIRYGKLLLLPLIGVGILLLPGFLYFVWGSIKYREIKNIAAILWLLGFIGIYALRLPVTYQYGRYIIPAMPVFFIIGAIGEYQLIQKMKNMSRKMWMVSTAWLLTTIGVWVGFYGIGANAYSNDVGIIETEMVAAAKWAARHTPPDSIIAAHDIGAIGYFGERKLVDLAGLVSPEVIPFIRDETKLSEYMTLKKVNYLITFPEWYPKLTSQTKEIFQTNGRFSPKAGGENMAIYEWLNR